MAGQFLARALKCLAQNVVMRQRLVLASLVGLILLTFGRRGSELSAFVRHGIVEDWSERAASDAGVVEDVCGGEYGR